MSWLKTIVKHLDYLRGRYEAFPVRDEVTRTGVLQVLDEVRRPDIATDPTAAGPNRARLIEPL